MRSLLSLIFVLLFALPASAQPEEYTFLPYKNGDSWPGRNFNGVDFLEPFVPVNSARNGEVGRIVLDTAVPYSLLASSFSISRPEDKAISREIRKWNGLQLDSNLDNYGVLMGYIALSMASMLLPAPEDQYGYNWHLRLDRLTVFTLGMCIPTLIREATVPIFDVPRPDGSNYTSTNDARPAGHVAAAFATAAFMSHTLRDWWQPHRETNLLLRIGEEVGIALVYAPAVYVMLERIKSNKHTLVDTLLGAAIGSFTMNLFYSWSFERRELGRGWIDGLDLTYDPDQRGYMLALSGRF
ncbi:MAG: phosphatase PAP2 family protein [Planctomycetota bacterium]